MTSHWVCYGELGWTQCGGIWGDLAKNFFGVKKAEKGNAPGSESEKGATESECFI